MNVQHPFFLPKLTDYWDSGTDAIQSLATKLDSYPPSNREQALQAIRAAVEEHVRVLSDKFLYHAAVIVADDLYKTANSIPLVSDTIFQYLAASACTFFAVLRDRGFVVHYLVESTFSGHERPFLFFPAWFAACEINYECPQLTQAAEGVGLASAIQSCSHRIQTYFAQRKHYLLLDIDCCEASFEEPRAQQDEPGVITVFHRITCRLYSHRSLVNRS